MTAIATSRNQLPSLSFAAGPGCVPIDLDRLVGTRLLIQTNSGGGKSYCLRWLLEQTHGQIQQFVLDTKTMSAEPTHNWHRPTDRPIHRGIIDVTLYFC